MNQFITNESLKQRTTPNQHPSKQLELEIDQREFETEIAPESFFSLDPNKRISACDEQAIELLGLDQFGDRSLASCSNLSSKLVGRIYQAVEALWSEPIERAQSIRIHLSQQDSLEAEPYWLTFIRTLDSSSNNATCCSLEPLSSRSILRATVNHKGDCLDEIGIETWYLEHSENVFHFQSPTISKKVYKESENSCPFSEWVASIHPDDQSNFIDEFESLQNGMFTQCHIRYRIRLNTSEWAWISTLAHREKRRNSHAPFIVGLHKEERPILNTRDELNRIAFLANRVRTPIIITDESNRISWFNTAYEQMTGYELSEIVGNNPGVKLQGPLSQVDAISHMRMRIEHGKPFHAELINYHKDGKPFWVRLDANPIVDSNGKVTNFVAFITDISETKKTLNAIVKNEEKFRSLFDNSSNGLLVISPSDGVVIEVNKAATELFESSRLIGNRFDHILPQVSLPSKQDIHDAKNRKISAFDVVEFACQDGRTKTFDITASLIPIGDSNAILVALRDISEKRMLEEQLRHAQRMEAVGKLAGGIAHDFNNVLAGLRGFSELIASSNDLSRQNRAYVNELLKTAHRATKLTSRLLSFSRRIEDEPIVTNLNAIVDGIYPMLSRILNEDIYFKTELDTNLRNAILDVSQIEQIVLNLVVNAQEAITGSDPKIIVRTKTESLDGSELFITGKPKPGEYAVLEVEDNGHGMHPEIIEKIFEPFFTTKHGAGTGLGLSIVYGIIENANGHPSVISQPNRGTIFKMHFPIVNEQAPPPEPSDEDNTIPQSNTNSLTTIMIAEDQDQVREILELGLGQSGYRLLLARDGKEAIDIANNTESRIDLLLTDAMMPKMHGTELAKEIRLKHQGIKVVLMSGLPETELIEEGDEDCIDAYVDKPFSIKKLVELIDSILLARQEQQS